MSRDPCLVALTLGINREGQELIVQAAQQHGGMGRQWAVWYDLPAMRSLDTHWALAAINCCWTRRAAALAMC
jgi:hypothetical protein